MKNGGNDRAEENNKILDFYFRVGGIGRDAQYHKKHFTENIEVFNNPNAVLKDYLKVLSKQKEAWKLLKNKYEEYLGFLESAEESEILKKRFTPLLGTLKELNEVEDAVAQKQEEISKTKLEDKNE